MDWARAGRSVRALRIRANLTQRDLAARARVPRNVVSAIELGRSAAVKLHQFDRVAVALDASVDVRIRWRGEQLDRLLDEAHAVTVAATVERLRRLGWETAIEVSFSVWGERGSIDVLAAHRATDTVLIVKSSRSLPTSSRSSAAWIEKRVWPRASRTTAAGRRRR